MFSNYGNLPYMVIDSITTEIEPYSKDPTALSRGLAYSSLFLFTSSAWMWSFGPYYMSRGSRSVPVQSLDEITSNNNSFVRSRSSSSCSEAFLPDVSKNCAASDSFSVSARQTLNSSPALQQVVVPLEQLHIPVQKDEEPSSSTSSCNFETLDGTYLCQTPLQASPICPGSDDQFLQQPPNTFSKFKEKICHFFRSTFQLLRKLVSPSTISCILAISIVLINPVHRALFHDVPSMISNPSRPALQPTSIPTPDGDSAPPPLKFIADVIEILGDASIPLSLTILGSSLYQTLKPSSTSTSYSVSPSAAQLTHRLSPRAIIAIAVAAKLLFMPIFAFSVAYLLSLVGLSIRDSLVFLVLTIEGSSPSAINLIVLIQITNSQDVMQTISFIIFFQYLFAMITMPLVVLTSVSIFG
ncbi:uncharacterized protein LOC126326038 [Schistocerca gregaria]|uniref:uncharacterized protein LOC126326038 n=1 Tax=Schistocerca gregaria TaxID=7010 RepID=UPI00211E21EA|nr:uncharacterized protein LOC126326038 [Schistocerca gregaria]